MKIDELEFSTRTNYCLKRVGIDTVEELFTMSDTDLMKIRGFGVKCLAEVHEKIRKPYGITITPAIPGPSDADPNIMELCFHNGEQHMKEKVISLLMEHRTQVMGECHEHVVEIIKMVEAL